MWARLSVLRILKDAVGAVIVVLLAYAGIWVLLVSLLMCCLTPKQLQIITIGSSGDDNNPRWAFPAEVESLFITMVLNLA